MQIIEHEIKKYDLWRQELNEKKRAAESAGEKSAQRKDFEKTKRKFDGLVRKQDQLLRGVDN